MTQVKLTEAERRQITVLSHIIEQGVASAMKKTVSHVMNLVFIGIAAAAIYLYLFTDRFDYDSTDMIGKRSGMSLHVDALTGCHWLGGKDGGLTPRMGSDGKQICNEQLGGN